MKAPKSLFAILLLLSTHCFSQDEQTKIELSSNIDWLAGQTGAPTQARTYLRLVPTGLGLQVPRGFLSAQICLDYATIFALDGQKGYAIEWLKAGQDHNEGVQALFDQYPDYCVEYIKSVYRRQAAAAFGLGTYGAYVKTALGEIAKYNPSPNDAPAAPQENTQNRPPHDRPDHGGRQ